MFWRSRGKTRMNFVLTVGLVCLFLPVVYAHSVHLVPRPFAKVEEGNPLTLRCSYHGSNTPGCINWYLNNDTYGLVIEASSCNYISTPEQYEIGRYNISCHESTFELSIARISKDKDHQVFWRCDTTVNGMVPPQKSSTEIVVIDAGPADPKSGQVDQPKTVVVVVVVVVVITVFAIIAGCFLYRKRRNGHDKKMTNREHHEGEEKNVMI